ncbi:hypothetical protein BRC65_02190 [Halobacteriales archaeon QH_2_65_14]|nr:MAG: hypothetical protein BRC65_02190 [Halobacteriales archaeon QH_2_65_14]
MIRVVPGGDILGVACATGRFTRYAAKTADHVWGVDVSEGMLEKAGRYARREGIENVTFARMDAGNLHFRSDFFDGVACCWALHLFPDVRGPPGERHRVCSRWTVRRDDVARGTPAVAPGCGIGRSRVRATWRGALFRCER